MLLWVCRNSERVTPNGAFYTKIHDCRPISRSISETIYEGWSASNDKNIETADHERNCFTVIVSSKCNAFSPAMCKSFYAVHEELLIQLFKPVIYGMDDIFITLKCLSTKWIFQDRNTWKSDGARSVEYDGWFSSSKPHSRIAAIAKTAEVWAGAFNQSINQSINQKRIRVTKVTNVTARPLLQC